jgi:hypothetical protein
MISGATLILTGLCAAFFWFYWIAPLRHTLDPQWHRRHSQRAYWDEMQKLRHRPGFPTLAVTGDGPFGGKEWLEWRVEHAPREGELFCGCATAGMAMMANQEPDGDWRQWWAENGNKSQEQWLQDGFAVHGCQVQLPPSSNDWPGLLQLLGNTSTNEADRIPGYVKFNAFRWLRDSGFEPVSYALSGVTDSTSDEIRRGLEDYVRRERWWPSRDAVGLLAFADAPETAWLEGELLPAILSKRFRVGVYVLVFGAPLLGLLLLVLCARRQSQRRS